MDAALVKRTNGLDLAIAGNDLRTVQGLSTAILISLFTDRRAEDDDELPLGTTDRRGWWGDAFADVSGDRIGSRLWLLRRAKQTQQTLNRAKEYAHEALAWLIDDGVATSLQIAASNAGNAILSLEISITLPDGTPFDQVYEYSLEAA